MGVLVGIDLGSVSLKAALLAEEGDEPLPDSLLRSGAFRRIAAPRPLALSTYQRTLGDPLGAASALLRTVRAALPELPWSAIRVTGAGSALLAARLSVARVNDFVALAAAMGLLHPDVATVFEMGGHSSRFLRLRHDAAEGRMVILDYETNGDCAAGTGAFIDQQASRLRYAVEEIGAIACAAPSAVRIAGRCSVFAKSDMIHAQQKGAAPPQILRGLCEAVARNFKGSITKGKPVEPPVALVGGLAWNAGVVRALGEAFALGEGGLLVPEAAAWFGAIGAAVCAGTLPAGRPGALPVREPAAPGGGGNGDGAEGGPLSLQNVLLLRERTEPAALPPPTARVPAYLGIDVGSVSTNLVVLDEAGAVLHEIYARTEGRPIQVVTAGLGEIAAALSDRIRIVAAGTTGSGRELVGALIGADSIADEITAHSAGALSISRRRGGAPVDTIFEIGGQDAKFIALDGGVVVDFAMNEACAAGTGSFLEEQAERLGIAVKEEFARLAFASTQPTRLGERCTVFMDQDLTAWLQRGARREDLVAGLATSVVLNYLHRVVRGRRIGDAIYFQGGTAYNDAVAAAFAGILKRRIVVPPHNGVIGAIGVALLAREKMQGTGGSTRFRGFDLSAVSYRLREFVCRACPNNCDIQEFSVEGVKTYWGDRCSDRFRARRQSLRQPVIPDLVALRRERLLDGYAGPAGSGPRVGFPRAMVFFDRFPFWRTFLQELGCAVLLSGDTNRAIANAGIELSVAEPCYPVRVAHGHVQELVAGGAEYLLLPNTVNAEATPDTPESQYCPWAQTLPFVVRSVPRLQDFAERILAPTVHFRLGERHVEDALVPLGRRLGAGPAATRRAVRAAFRAQRAFREAVEAAGGRALRLLEERREPGIVLLGRSYNIHDRGVNLDLPGKLRDYYGLNVLPVDCLPLDALDIRDVNDNMYWHSGRRILAAAKLAAAAPHLHLIYCSNFKCGPDSYIKHFVARASGKPTLSLSFDEHSSDAGMLTRCEAFLDSQGILRWWRQPMTA